MYMNVYEFIKSLRRAKMINDCEWRAGQGDGMCVLLHMCVHIRYRDYSTSPHIKNAPSV